MTEWYGTPFQRAVQQKIFRYQSLLRQVSLLVPQGRSLYFFHIEKNTPATLEKVIVFFQRILVQVKPSNLHHLEALFQRRPGLCRENLTLWGRDVTGLDIPQRFPSDLILGRLDKNTATKEVLAIQKLHVQCGLTPLPGWFLRGGAPGVVCLTLHHNNKELVGAGVVQRLAPGLLGAHATAVILGLCVAPNFRGHGLGILLNQACIGVARHDLKAHQAFEIIEHQNEASQQLNRKCGFQPRADLGFVFVMMQASPAASENVAPTLSDFQRE